MCILPIIARQRLGKNGITATNTHATIEKLLEASFSMCFASYQRKVCDYFLPEFLVALSYIHHDTSYMRKYDGDKNLSRDMNLFTRTTTQYEQAGFEIPSLCVDVPFASV
jgi:hypothetical protein